MVPCLLAALLAAPPELSGLYRAFPAVAQYGAAVGEAYVFAPDGSAYRGWPGARTVVPFDFVAAGRREPGTVGKYAVANGRITFRWSDGKTESAAFSVRGPDRSGHKTIAIGPNFVYRIVPHKGALSGTFEPSTYQGGFDHAREVGDRIEFSPDGRFATTGDGAAQGRYKIIGAALTLTTSGGERRAYSLHTFEGSKGVPSTVLIDGRPFNAAKGKA